MFSAPWCLCGSAIWTQPPAQPSKTPQSATHPFRELLQPSCRSSRKTETSHQNLSCQSHPAPTKLPSPARRRQPLQPSAREAGLATAGYRRVRPDRRSTSSGWDQDRCTEPPLKTGMRQALPSWLFGATCELFVPIDRERNEGSEPGLSCEASTGLTADLSAWHY